MQLISQVSDTTHWIVLWCHPSCCPFSKALIKCSWWGYQKQLPYSNRDVRKVSCGFCILNLWNSVHAYFIYKNLSLIVTCIYSCIHNNISQKSLRAIGKILSQAKSLTRYSQAWVLYSLFRADKLCSSLLLECCCWSIYILRVGLYTKAKQGCL